MSGPKIAVVGAGPAGLTFARLLQRNGLACTVYEGEKDRSVRDQGGSLDLHAKGGQAALNEAGLFEQFRNHARPEAQALKVVSYDGEVLWDENEMGNSRPEEFDDRPEIDRNALRFDSIADFSPLVYYSKTRIFLQRLCLVLHSIIPARSSFDRELLEAENCRMASNLLMCWEFSFELGAFGTSRGGAGTMALSIAMIALWACLTDVADFRGQNSAKIQEWVLLRFQDLIGGVQKISSEDMDEMAELFAGGPISGVIPGLIRHP